MAHTRYVWKHISRIKILLWMSLKRENMPILFLILHSKKEVISQNIQCTIILTNQRSINDLYVAYIYTQYYDHLWAAFGLILPILQVHCKTIAPLLHDFWWFFWPQIARREELTIWHPDLFLRRVLFSAWLVVNTT